MHFAPSGAMIYHLFEKFDANKDGRLSSTEFKTMLNEVNMTATKEELQILFNRFDDDPRDGSLDCAEFLRFYEVYGKVLKFRRKNDVVDQRPLERVLSMVKKALHPHLAGCGGGSGGTPAAGSGGPKEQAGNEGKTTLSTEPLGAATAPEDLGTTIIQTKQANPPARTFDNAIFALLQESETRKNVTILKSYGVELSEKEMLRISRIFDFDVTKFMRFMRTDDCREDMKERLRDTLRKLFQGMHSAGCSSAAVLKGASMDPHDFVPDAKTAAVSPATDLLKMWGLLSSDICKK